MSENLPTQIIRSAINFATKDTPQDLATAAPFAIWNGTSFQLQLAFFYSSELLSLDGYDAILLEVKESSTRTGLPIISKTVPASGINTALTVEDWEAGDDQHVAIEVLAGENSFDLQTNEEDFWIVISALVHHTSIIQQANDFDHPVIQTDVLDVGVLDITVVRVTKRDADGLILETGEVDVDYTVDGPNGTVEIISSLLATSSGEYVSVEFTYELVHLDKTVLGAGTITVQESGFGVASPPTVVQPTYLTADQSIAMFESAIDNSQRDINIQQALDDSAAAVAAASAATSAVAGKMPLAGGTFAGDVVFASTKFLTLSADPTNLLHAATKQYVDTADALKLAKSGDTMSGLLQWSGTTHAGIKLISLTTTQRNALTGAAGNVVFDSTLNRFEFYNGTTWVTPVDLAGDTMTGALILSGAPTLDLHASTKKYVDDSIISLINGAPANLDTLDELAAAIGDDAAFSTTMTTALNLRLKLDGTVQMTGQLQLVGTGTPSGNNAIWKSYADSTYLGLAGGTLTGLLTLVSTTPSASDHATRKQYVDDQDALKLSLSGGIMTGELLWSGSSPTTLGLRVLSVTSSVAASLIAANGHIYYDSTISKLMAVEGATRKQVIGGASGVTWYSQSGAPSVGTGINGDFSIDEDDGAVYKKSSGTWNVIVGARLPLAGGIVTGNLEITGAALLIDGTQVVGAQEAHIADPTGGATQDAESRTAIGSILNLLEAHGLMAP